MVDSVLFHLKNGSDYRHLALGIAGWMRYVSGEGENGEVIDVRDPLLSRFQAIYAEHGLSCNVVKPLLAIEAIFGPNCHNRGFCRCSHQAYQGLLDHGARHCVAAI